MAATGEKIVPGEFSGIGRITERAARKLKIKVQLQDEEIANYGKKAPMESQAGKPSRSQSSPLGSSQASPKGGLLGRKASTGGGDVIPSVFGEAARGASEGSETVPEEFGPATPRILSPAPFCDLAVPLHGRWVLKSSLEKKPVVGQYRIHEAEVTKDRSSKWDFVKDQGRKSLHKQGECERELSGGGLEFDLSRLSLASTRASSPKGFPGASPMSSMYTSHEPGSPMSTLSRAQTAPGSVSLMVKQQTRDLSDWDMGTWPPHAELQGKKALAPGRLWTTCYQNCRKDACDPAEDLPDQDRKTSAVLRRPEWDFAKLPPRKWPVITNFFEPAKYKIKYDCTDYTRTKVGMEEAAQLSMEVRPSGRVNVSEEFAVLEKDTKKIGITPDRSMHRKSRETRPRTTHVREMGKVIERQPFFNASPAYYDEDDLEASATVLEQEMTVDRSVLDLPIAARKDLGMAMCRLSSRVIAGKGNRLEVSTSLGCLGQYPESLQDLEKPVATTKEKPSRLRPDIGVNFKQQKGRSKGSYINLSSLRQPRDYLSPDFSRAAPMRGFAPRATVSSIARVPPASRSFTALEGFDVKDFEDC